MTKKGKLGATPSVTSPSNINLSDTIARGS